MSIWLVNWPLPPSENSRLELARGRIIKSKIHRQYQDICLLWSRDRRNMAAIDHASRFLNHIKKLNHDANLPFALRVDCYFVLEKSRILTDTNKSRGLDADNLIKATLDALAKVLQIDDRHFYQASCEKVFAYKKEHECTMIKISHMTPRSSTQVKNQMLQEGVF